MAWYSRDASYAGTVASKSCVHGAGTDGRTVCGRRISGAWKHDAEQMATMETVTCARCRSELYLDLQDLESFRRAEAERIRTDLAFRALDCHDALLEAAKHAVMEWRLHGQLTDSCRVLERAIAKAESKWCPARQAVCPVVPQCARDCAGATHV